MSYTVLARRYRSGDFDQVVGQEPISRTFKNAIASGRVAHAYLFTGTRGVGKTSMARILATALNAPDTVAGCPKLPGEIAYPSIEIQQRMNAAIMRGDDLNVIEIDGASNRSVDEARQLIANAALAPTGDARFKIYIIDEVHMLTREAFNALLKTMEEPPSHVKFILCTTEAHKVPTTIQSRCQRFDFRNIATSAIAGHLANVLETERIGAEKQLIWQVAKLGNGSMRDALSLLDRLIAASGCAAVEESGNHRSADEPKPLTSRLLEEMLGLPDQDMVAALVDTFVTGDVARALELAGQFLGRGITQDQLIEVLIERLRQMLLIVACGADSELVELSDENREAVTAQSKQFDASGIVYMIALCENLQRLSKTSANPRALFDAVVVRLAIAERMADVTALLTSQRRETLPSIAEEPRLTVKHNAGKVPAKKKQTPLVTPAETGLPTNVADTWDRLLVSIGDKPSMAWVRHLAPVRMDLTAIHIAALPGHREVMGFVNAHRRQQLADLFKVIVGRPLCVELDAGAVSEEQNPSINSAVNNVIQGKAVSSPNRLVTEDDRAEVMSLPLVKQVVEVFDATLVAVQRVAKATRENDAVATGNPVAQKSITVSR